MTIITILILSALFNSNISSNDYYDGNIRNDLTNKLKYIEDHHRTESLDSLWTKLVFEKGGCLTGGQYVHSGIFGNEGCVLTQDKEWNNFFQFPKEELTLFLISKMRDKTSTNIHTCPFFSATEGELAVYCLHNIYKINWFDFIPIEKNGNVKLQYAGANNPLWIVRNQEILETKADKQPIGKFDNPEPYTTHSFELEKGDNLYIFSDGYVDQFGGENGKKFKAKAFRELLLSIQEIPMEKQGLLIDETFESWRGNLEQIDDVCVLGVKI